MNFPPETLWCLFISLCSRVTVDAANNIKTTTFWSHITHLSLASYKRDIGKECRPRSDAAERSVRSGSTLFALSKGISVNHGNNKN